MIKILFGGSPCTHWSIAQSKNRETTNSGQGWELFMNYAIAKEKFKPDYFLYENVASASKEIKEQISKALGVELMEINSALVSAQTRKRIYGFNWKCEQPEDRGILLKDVLVDGGATHGLEKAHCLTKSYTGAEIKNSITKCQRDMVAVRIGVFPNSDGSIQNSQANRIYSIDAKGVSLVANGGGRGAKTGLYAIGMASRTRQRTAGKYKVLECNGIEKSNAITTVETDSMVATTAAENEKNVYEVKAGKIRIKDKWFNVKLQDGYYTIRKLYPVECERLQTLPDGYTGGLSNTQRYKCLGNGWTAEVIKHILQAGIGHIDRNEKIVALSMYDGIATARYVLDSMGFKNVEYHAYEIDKYAKQAAMKNYPDIMQHGDAFNVREEMQWIETI